MNAPARADVEATALAAGAADPDEDYPTDEEARAGAEDHAGAVREILAQLDAPKPQRPDFWDDADEAVILEPQPRTAVYMNPFRAVVIRQESFSGDDGEDAVVVIRPEHAEAVAQAIIREARLILGDRKASHAPGAPRACTREAATEPALDLVGGGRR